MASFLTTTDYIDAYHQLMTRKMAGVGPLLFKLRQVCVSKVSIKMSQLSADYIAILQVMNVYVSQNIKDAAREEHSRKTAQSFLKPYKIKVEDERLHSKIIERKISLANQSNDGQKANPLKLNSDAESITNAIKLERISLMDQELKAVSGKDFGTAVKEFNSCISDMKALNHNYRLRQSDIRNTVACIENSLRTTNSSILKYVHKPSSSRVQASPLAKSNIISTTRFEKAQKTSSGVDIRSRRIYAPEDHPIFNSMHESGVDSGSSARNKKSTFRLRETKVYRSANFPSIGGSMSLREFAVDSSIL